MSGGQQRARRPVEHEGGPASRDGTWNPSTASIWAAPPSLAQPSPARPSPAQPSPARPGPARPSPALPISRRICDACKFQVTGRGASKLVGASDGPEAPRRCTERVLAVLPAAAGSLGWAGTDQDARATGLGSAFPPTPVPPSHHHSALPSESQPSALGVPASGSVCEAPGHSLCSH